VFQRARRIYTLLSYKCKQNKVVVLLSTMQMSAGAFGGEPKKVPEMITFYNRTKGGVDCADQMIQIYSSKFSTRRWPVVVFCNILDFAALNAYVLNEKLKPAGASTTKRRLFLRELGKSLCQPLRDERKRSETSADLAKARQLDTSQELPRKRGQCHVCTRQDDKKCTAACHACHRNVCPNHCAVFCDTCLSGD